MGSDIGQAPPASSNGIVRTGKGLTIAGTRITLYDVLDYAHQDWPPRRIAEWLHLSPQEVDAALAYIASHRAEVEAEYQQVLDAALRERAYWEERNRERFDRIRREPVPREKAAIADRLRRFRESIES